jgi:hypothetical protein
VARRMLGVGVLYEGDLVITPDEKIGIFP